MCESNPKATIIGSIGTISKDLGEIAEMKPNEGELWLLRGAMGAALPFGIGYAKARPDTKTIVVIGDGSLLMKLGALSTYLAEDLENLEVHVINNGCYRSCGGQKTNFEFIRSMLPISERFHVHNIRD